MAVWNVTERAICCELVYWGPPGAGKTQTLKAIGRELGGEEGPSSGRLRHAEPDRLELCPGRLAGMEVRLAAHAPDPSAEGEGRTPIEEHLRVADGVVFVADSRRDRLEANMRCLARLEEILAALGRDSSLPLVFQWNRRDERDALAVAELDGVLNPRGRPAYKSVASSGANVTRPLRRSGALILERARRDFGLVPTRPAPARRPTSAPEDRVVVGVRERPGLWARVARALAGRAPVRASA